MTFGVLGAGNPQIWRDQLDLLDATAADGGRMFAQTHCRGVSVLLSFKTRLPFDKLPEWRELRALPLDAQEELLRRPEVRERLVRAANEGDYGHAVGAEARQPRYDRIHVLERATGRNPTLAELAEATGRDPVEIVIDLGLESKFEVFFQQFPVKPRPGGDRGDAQAPADGDDVLRLRRARQPDHGLVDPDRPARRLGARPRRCSPSRRPCG